jgi:hypothetical protein
MWYQIRDRLFWRNNNNVVSSSHNRNPPENINIPEGTHEPLPTTPEVLLIPKNPFSKDSRQDNMSSQALNPSTPAKSLKHHFDPYSTNSCSSASAETVIMPHAVNVPLSEEVTRT